MFTVLALSACLLRAGQLPVPPVMMIDFGAKWCKPCQKFKPIIERLQTRQLPIAYVDIDDPQYAELVRENKVGQIPYFLMMIDGRPTEYIEGKEATEEMLQSWLERWMKKRYGESDVQHPLTATQKEPLPNFNVVICPDAPRIARPKIDLAIIAPHIPSFVNSIKFVEWDDFLKVSDQRKLNIDFAISTMILAAAVKAEDPKYKDLDKLIKFAQQSLEYAISQADAHDQTLIALRTSDESAWIRRYVKKHWGDAWDVKLMGNTKAE